VARAYEQHCGLAHALDLVGERWTLLIVRELLVGPRRYTDLADGLVSVPSNLLATRLREMQANGLVERRTLPAPAASVVVYELTPEGARLAAAVTELTRWGARTLAATPAGRPFKAHWLVPALAARFNAPAAVGVNESYELQIDGQEPVGFHVADGAGEAKLGAVEDPAVRLAADLDTFMAFSAGAIDAREAFARGARIEGAPQAIARMSTILPAPAR
jgi:DNA-binding HxlR family transcriptional regulator